MKNILIFSSLIFLLSNCATKAPTKDPIPNHETFTIKSTNLGEERTINIWLPKNYKKMNNDSFPVMYMLDGGIKEDFPHIANTLASLIEAGKIKPLILVGIENTQRRRDLTGFTAIESDKKIAPEVGGSQLFRAFIAQELFPAIQSKYKTKGSKSIIGESLAGLFILETFFLKPEMFDHYIAFDPSLWWNNHSLVTQGKKYLEHFPKTQKSVWFAGSNAEDINKYTLELSQLLSTIQINNLRWKYENEPKQTHQTIFRATKEKAIIWSLQVDE